MVYLKNNYGFTLVTLLFILSLLFIMIPILTYSIHTLSNKSYYEELSIQQFFHALQIEATKAKSVAVYPHFIELELANKKTATIEKYGTLIRRRVNQTGHEVYVRDISDVAFEENGYGFTIQLSDKSGEKYEKTIVTYE